LQDVGTDGIRVSFTIPTDFGPDNEIEGGRDEAFPFPIGNIMVLPSVAGKTFTLTTTLTSVLWNGTAATVVRTQSFTTTP